MKIGAASMTVTLTLAAVLVMIGRNTVPTPPEPRQPSDPSVVAAEPPPSARAPEAAVRLPPPPSASQATASPSPRPAEIVKPVPAAVSRIQPLRPRPAAVSPPPTENPAPVAAPEQPAPEPGGAAASALQTAVVTPVATSEGRALLRLLEAGEGPVIEIAWPASAEDRSRLYRRLTACFGMRTAVMRGESELFVADGAPGTAWRPNRDAVSGFVRQPTGVLTPAERAEIRKIGQYHGGVPGMPVRVFPRAVDATLLGGLRQIVGAGYATHKVIRARYTITGSRIALADISADGAARPGRIVLPAGRCG